MCETDELRDTIEMPKFNCHKQVWALKLLSVTLDGPTGRDQEDDGNVATLSFHDSRFPPVRADSKYIGKHSPVAGGYYVVYKDGYKSFSPAEAFESGYSLA